MASSSDFLTQFSDALAARVATSHSIVAALLVGGAPAGAGVLWRDTIVIASEQAFPRKADTAEISFGGEAVTARVAGRDSGTNIVALRLEQPIHAALPPRTEPRLGAVALALGRDSDGATARLGIVSALGPEWHSQGGGRIDRRIVLHLSLSRREEGGPVLDAAGGLLGMSTTGPRGRSLVIPGTTIDRVLVPLLDRGRIERGWLGLALHLVAIPESLRAEAGATRGLMVMDVGAASPGAKAGVVAGDILVTLDGGSVAHPARLSERLGPDSIGRDLALRLIRAGAVTSLTVTPEARPNG